MQSKSRTSAKLRPSLPYFTTVRKTTFLQAKPQTLYDKRYHRKILIRGPDATLLRITEWCNKTLMRHKAVCCPSPKPALVTKSPTFWKRERRLLQPWPRPERHQRKGKVQISSLLLSKRRSHKWFRRQLRFKGKSSFGK